MRSFAVSKLIFNGAPPIRVVGKLEVSRYGFCSYYSFGHETLNAISTDALSSFLSISSANSILSIRVSTCFNISSKFYPILETIFYIFSYLSVDICNALRCSTPSY